MVGFNDALRQQSQATSVLRARRLGFLAHRQQSLVEDKTNKWAQAWSSAMLW